MEVMPTSQMMRWAVGSMWSDNKQQVYFKDHFIWRDIQKVLARYMLRQLGQQA
jgi:hypothetical protein